MEFHDQALCIGKVFGQELTVFEWNYQILGLHQVTVHQKLGVILVIKWFKNWSQQKMLFTKKVCLNWYSSMNFFLERFGWFLTLKINFENQILAFFDVYFWPFNMSHEKINAIFVISATMASIWNLFIKFHWHDEKLITGHVVYKMAYNQILQTKETILETFVKVQSLHSWYLYSCKYILRH